MSDAKVHVQKARAHLIRTRKYIAVISMDTRGGSFFSTTGWSTFIDHKDANPEWIGENLRKALETSRDYVVEWGEYPLPREKNLEEDKKSFPIYMDFWTRVSGEIRLQGLARSADQISACFC